MSSPKLICIFDVSVAILTRKTREIIMKNGKNIVKNDLVKFEEIYPFTLTINERFQKLCGLCIIEVDNECRQG